MGRAPIIVAGTSIDAVWRRLFCVCDSLRCDVYWPKPTLYGVATSLTTTEHCACVSLKPRLRSEPTRKLRRFFEPPRSICGAIAQSQSGWRTCGANQLVCPATYASGRG